MKHAFNYKRERDLKRIARASRSKYSAKDWQIDRPAIWRGLAQLPPPRTEPVTDSRTGRPITLPKLKFLGERP